LLKDLLLPLSVVFVTSLLVTPRLIGLAWRIGALDVPRRDLKVHDTPTPRIGGVAVALSFFIGYLILISSTTFFKGISVGMIHESRAFLIGAAGVIVLGFYDDISFASPWLKLTVQMLLAGILYSGGIRLTGVSIPALGSLEFGPWSLLVTVLWVVGVMNAINLIDGLDGLCAGISILTLLTLTVLGTISGLYFHSSLALLLIASVTGFLIYNFPPARIFLGDSGSLFLGYSLASFSVWKADSSENTMFPLVAACSLVVPLGDTTLAVIRRLVQGRRVFAGDMDHIHHRLLFSGLSQTRAVLILYLFTMAGSAVGILFAVGKGSFLFTSLSLALIVLLSYLFISLYVACGTALATGFFRLLLLVELLREGIIYSGLAEKLKTVRHLREAERAVSASLRPWKFVSLSLVEQLAAGNGAENNEGNGGAGHPARYLATETNGQVRVRMGSLSLPLREVDLVFEGRVVPYFLASEKKRARFANFLFKSIENTVWQANEPGAV